MVTYAQAKDTMLYILDTSAARLVLTFLMLHTIHYVATMSHASWCLDFGTFGYVRTIFTGHGPLCHILLSTSYHAQANIYQLLGLSFISTGISYLTKRTNKEKDEWKTE